MDIDCITIMIYKIFDIIWRQSINSDPIHNHNKTDHHQEILSSIYLPIQSVLWGSMYVITYSLFAIRTKLALKGSAYDVSKCQSYIINLPFILGIPIIIIMPSIFGFDEYQSIGSVLGSLLLLIFYLGTISLLTIFTVKMKLITSDLGKLTEITSKDVEIPTDHDPKSVEIVCKDGIENDMEQTRNKKGRVRCHTDSTVDTNGNLSQIDEHKKMQRDEITENPIEEVKNLMIQMSILVLFTVIFGLIQSFLVVYTQIIEFNRLNECIYRTYNAVFVFINVLCTHLTFKESNKYYNRICIVCHSFFRIYVCG